MAVSNTFTRKKKKVRVQPCLFLVFFLHHISLFVLYSLNGLEQWPESKKQRCPFYGHGPWTHDHYDLLVLNYYYIFQYLSHEFFNTIWSLPWSQGEDFWEYIGNKYENISTKRESQANDQQCRNKIIGCTTSQEGDINLITGQHEISERRYHTKHQEANDTHLDLALKSENDTNITTKATSLKTTSLNHK